MKFDLLKIMNLIFLSMTLVVFLYFLITVQNSDNSIGHKISEETYADSNGETDKAEWMWNLGEFVAIMMGFYSLMNVFYELAFSNNISRRKTNVKKSKP